MNRIIAFLILFSLITCCATIRPNFEEAIQNSENASKEAADLAKKVDNKPISEITEEEKDKLSKKLKEFSTKFANNAEMLKKSKAYGDEWKQKAEDYRPDAETWRTIKFFFYVFLILFIAVALAILGIRLYLKYGSLSGVANVANLISKSPVDIPFLTKHVESNVIPF
ncbi:hypothetical protein [Leptospira adleri]|uniref:Lipoprotein n=1 Tax=Leptospira adleri TaxID=2023186 RepID=A0A2M9YJA4_9LEPT|nr:hypothetical protein [Leptospira adleri]PJZ51584.1 hypothetical protein CH380_19250 [Leptospira adleri]PJZ61907.1 hypothetical protein CH376_10915 [Leptospira adleri]